MKEMKRVLALLLCVVMLVGVMPVNALAADDDAAAEQSAVVSEEITQEPSEDAPAGEEPSADSAVTDAPAEVESSEDAAVTDVPADVEPSAEYGVMTTAGDTDARATTNSVVVISGSDFQHDKGNDSSAATVKGILAKVKNDYPTIDGFLFAGDYSNNYDTTSSKNGKDALTAAVESVYGTGWNGVYIQGNHDEDSLVTDGTFSKSGNNDTKDYGVFVIHEQDYMWYNDDESRIIQTANNLDAYLDAKVKEGYTKPIFVISHLPLHYSMRNPVEAKNGKGDGTFANYIFDVLNEGGANGLDIIFLYGHNHAHGWDDYIGGEAVYLAVGDKINIAQKSTTVYKEETLKFTYMNAGFTGYYTDKCDHSIDSEAYLTMTVFEITDSQVLIKRYNQFGEYNLKSMGRRNNHVQTTHGKTEKMTVNEDTYDSGQKIALTVPVPDATYEDECTNITVTAPGITGVTVTVKTPTYDTEKYTAYASYDITLENYTDGNTAEVTIPAPAGFDTGKSAVVLYNDEKIAEDKDLSDGITFTTTHFSTYDVAQLAESAGVTASGNLVSETTVSNSAVSRVESGSYYLIQHAHDTSHRTLTNTTANNGKALSISGTVSTSNTNLWYITSANGGYYVQFGGPNGQYLTIGKDTAGLTNTATVIAIGDQESNEWSFGQKIDNTTYYLNQIGGRNNNNNYAAGWTGGGTDAGDHWNLYKVETGDGSPVTLTVEPSSLSLLPNTSKNLNASVLVDSTATSSYTINWTSSNTNFATVDNKGVVTGVADGNVTITATLTNANNQKVNGTVAVEIPVVVATKEIKSITVDPMEGSVERGSGNDVTTGSTMTVTYDDDTSEEIPVTVSMLSGDYNLKKNGTYENLTITYAGKTVTGYTLKVVDVVGNDFPSYPEGGSVKVEKSAAGQDFQNTGVARVELSASGLPSKKGVDLIVMLDTSSSMSKATDSDSDPKNNQISRLTALHNALTDLLKLLQEPDNDGGNKDIDIAIADFNGYQYIEGGTSTAEYFNSVSYVNDDKAPVTEIFTGSRTDGIGADDFMDVNDIENIAALVNRINLHSGTNYDDAMQQVYELATAKQAQNKENGEERDLYVIFMSDGAPYQFNYIGGRGDTPSGTTDNRWDRYLTGQSTTEDWNNYHGTHSYFYNGKGEHWMAEAIKGNPNQKYIVIDRNAGATIDVDKDGDLDQYMKEVYGLGATMYTIGLGLFADGNVDVASMEHVLKGMASTDENGEPLFTKTWSADELKTLFQIIGNKLRTAATNSTFVDQMGTAFDLQMNPTIKTNNPNYNGTTTEISTDITVTEYPVYTRAQIGTTVNGHTVTAEDVGKTYGNGTVLETVKFTSDTAATSSALTDANIIKDGVICAKNFFYNTTTSIKTITLANGTTYDLPGETFYWNIGTINEKKFTLSYAVYLTGSMQGETLPSDSYPTNNYATLSYTNWLGNDVSQSVTSPVMAWGAANVSYCFYLVDEYGNPLTQNGSPAENFWTSYKVTEIVPYKQILLNSGETVLSTIADDVLPIGYTLYDANAVYTVNVASGNGNSNWKIKAGNNGITDPDDENYYNNGVVANVVDGNGVDRPNVATTYVVGYGSGDEYSKELVADNNSYDYTHTTVYFAVVWTIGTVPDTVVIDFGLPVDISVMANDMFGTYGTLAGVGETAGTLTDMTGFGDTYTDVYGTAALNNGKVRYTPADMQMNSSEKFAYAVNYTGATNPGYYYGTVTVIPATNIYYEDSFLTLESYTVSGGESTKDVPSEWTQSTVDATQAEDRPGEYSLGTIDANNVYGYDGAYINMSTFSMNNAAMIHVTAEKRGEATFTFYGTGFDVISMTSNTTGTLVVQVFEGATAAGNAVRSTIVDTYYGMNEDGSLSVNKPEALYQVPVIKIKDLPYKQYTAKITAGYNTIFDHTEDEGGYDLYLDAIRIYDPAGTTFDMTDSEGKVIEGNIEDVIQDAYIADGEGWPKYQELRDNIIGASNYEVTENEDGTVTVTGENLSGAIFIDCNDAVTSIADYVSYGPNNELYLAKDQAIAFNVTTSDIVADVQLGIKVGNGGTVTYSINGDEKTVSSATDMYYSIQSYAKAGTVVIKNVSGGILSLTNIKVTYTQDPANTPDTSDLLWMDGPSAGRAIMSLRAVAVEEEIPEVSEPEVPEPEESEPEESEPEESEPKETEPKETEPKETEPKETTPEEDGSANETVEQVVKTVGEIIRKLLGWLFG